MKKILLALLVAIPMFAFAHAPKFGVVNTQTIAEAMPELKAAQEQVQASTQKYEEELKKLQEKIEKDFADFQALDANTPESIKERRMQDIQQQEQKMQQFHSTAMQDLQRQQAALMAPIQEKIQSAIQAVGKENNLTFIFESNVPLYVGTDVTDVTSMVRTKLGI